MCGRAALLVLLTALLTTAVNNNDPLDVGKSINVFATNPSISMKVLSRNGNNLLFLQPTSDIFVDLEKPSMRYQRFAETQTFGGNLTFDFCIDVDQLLRAYFSGFSFEGLNKPWRVFTASWSLESIAKYMGMHSFFMDDTHYSYVLVRLSRYTDVVDLSKSPSDIGLTEAATKEIERVKVGDVHSVVKFVENFGTHYIKSFVKGDSLYQVIVYKKSVFYRILERFKSSRSAEIPASEVSTYFSPWFTEHIGSVKAASGNKIVESWAASSFMMHHYVFTYASLLKVKGNAELLKYLNGVLKNEAILKMDMRLVASMFRDAIKRKWFVEVLDNYLRLWDSNA